MASVLIIDQDQHMRCLIRRVLERAAYGVTEAETLRDVNTHLVMNTPDIILDCVPQVRQAERLQHHGEPWGKVVSI